MASIQQDPSGTFHICFRYGKQRFKRSLQTTDRRKADAAAVRLAENIRLVNQGRMELPEDADIPTFLLSDGTLSNPPEPLSVLTIGNLFAKYQASIPADALEQSSLKTAKIHVRHFERLLGTKKPLRSVNTSDLQNYVTTRSKEPGHRGTISAATIRKEIATLGSLWNWAVAQGEIGKPYPRKGLIFPKRTEKPLFQTVGQIQRHIQKRRLTETQTAELWDAAYLDRIELHDLLEYVRKNANQEFLYAMCLLAAHTGARRSELCRCKLSDIDLRNSTITLHERKRSKSTRTTRVVPLSAKLNDVLRSWMKAKPDGEFLFPEVHDCFRERKEQQDEGAMQPDEATHHLSLTLSESQWKSLRGWHVFRHSFISNCATQGVDQRFIDSWVGHQTDEQRRRYRHLFPDSQKQAIDSVFSS